MTKEVRGFLGLTGYYRRFIKDYGKMAQPLTNLLKTNGFQWGTEAQEAFDKLKTAMTTDPVLALPDFNKDFTIECDASERGVGAVLMQEKRLVAYFSKTLSDKNMAKSTYEKELMALVLAVQHWRPYLLGQHFYILTDQRALKHLLDQWITTPDQQNWLIKLLGYDFEVNYKPGNTNQAADALSKLPGESELHAFSCAEWADAHKVQLEVQANPDLQQIIQELTVDPPAHPPYSWERGRLLYQGRLGDFGQVTVGSPVVERVP